MKINEIIGCREFPCQNINQKGYIIPAVDIKPETFSIILVSEATPDNPGDYYYSKGTSLFQQTTIEAFNDAGLKVSSIQELLNMGIYFTSAIKCSKIGYSIGTATIKECSLILEKEINLFPGVKAFLLMGDVAIKAINYVAARRGEKRVIPAGSTYKIRGGTFLFQGKRVFPSYLQAGPSFYIEKSKRKMIAEDIRAAFNLLN